MYQQKVPKSEKPDTSSYTIYHCHDIKEPVEWNIRTDYYRILSIDPGRRNFCFRIEHRDLISKIITMEAYEKIDLIGQNKDEKVVIDYIFRNVIMILEKYKIMINNCHLVIIERQLQINYRMVRFSQHIITYLMGLLRNNYNKTVIMEIAPTLKTKQFNVRGKLGKRDVKNWAIEKAKELLISRGDQASLNILNKAKSKKDDLSDTVVQIEAVFSLFGLLCTMNTTNNTIHKINNSNTELFNPKNTIGATINNVSNTYNISDTFLNNVLSTNVKLPIDTISINIDINNISLPDIIKK